eukprot:CAMPEP_0184655596 /NCGR_PEP_ID=MMETSP0308-20130426/13826_1 /TAXON_ID=38269 /ORGANISM="Gloeochaete witrockiana, Strain SAG 46.84" /LENGTH=184 /DNA_ID=CAMNT_0027092177 /DNA_START=20 /DNA_END=574 /DNA_ORIENTATION=+
MSNYEVPVATEEALAKIADLYTLDPKAKSAKKTRRPAPLRASITPGTVLILLKGRYKGKRVVFLRRLTSGALLVTGPFALNGVPLRRVQQAFVIATSTKVDVSKANVEKFTDDYFKTEKKAAVKGDFLTKKEKVPVVVADSRKADQKSVDDAILPAIKSVPLLDKYIKRSFTLVTGQKPHAIRF